MLKRILKKQNKKSIKRILSILIILSMIFTSNASFVFADGIDNLIGEENVEVEENVGVQNHPVNDFVRAQEEYTIVEDEVVDETVLESSVSIEDDDDETKVSDESNYAEEPEEDETEKIESDENSNETIEENIDESSEETKSSYESTEESTEEFSNETTEINETNNQCETTEEESKLEESEENNNKEEETTALDSEEFLSSQDIDLDIPKRIDDKLYGDTQYNDSIIYVPK